MKTKFRNLLLGTWKKCKIWNTGYMNFKSDCNLCWCDQFHFTCIVLIRVLNMIVFISSFHSFYFLQDFVWYLYNIFLIDLTNVVGPQREVNSEFEAGDKDIEEWERIPEATGKLSPLFITCLTLSHPFTGVTECSIDCSDLSQVITFNENWVKEMLTKGQVRGHTPWFFILSHYCIDSLKLIGKCLDHCVIPLIYS